MADIKAGDVVRLKSNDRQLMSVEYTELEYAALVWLDGDYKLQKAKVHKAALRVYAESVGENPTK